MTDTRMTDTQIVDWIEEHLIRFHFGSCGKYELEYYNSDFFDTDVVVADSLRECVELAVKEQDERN